MSWWRPKSNQDTPDRPGELCWACRGDGVQDVVERDRDGRETYRRETCRYCRGTGRL